MSALPLALEIADTVVAAQCPQTPLDVETLAEALSRSHPGSGYSPAEVAETLKEELAAAGVQGVRF